MQRSHAEPGAGKLSTKAPDFYKRPLSQTLPTVYFLMEIYEREGAEEGMQPLSLWKRERGRSSSGGRARPMKRGPLLSRLFSGQKELREEEGPFCKIMFEWKPCVCS
uniref:Uncharacterized protein n=1 Tax=Morchella brunnea TaxID=1174671 RepID=A0A8K1MIF8_9PEZI|nr:hypothetical protein LK370_mgp204 [Morchella brunnea]UBU98432.1 hypothetical protein [Morchella brunnea]